jgi:hypothetical protein
MIGMTVRDKNRSYPFTLQRCRQSLTVAVEARTRVDHDHVTTADDVRTGASIGELRGVLSNYSANIWSDLNRFAIDNIIERKKGG